jgi:protein-tyrosine phosphatase
VSRRSEIGERTRDLDWEGAFNVRDLGGLETRDGRKTRWGAVVRGDSLAGLTSAGWEALLAHGVRTVVDLRNDDERGPDVAPRPPGVRTIHVPLDVIDDTEFWKGWYDSPGFGTPMYYGPHIERFPERSAQALAAIAHAGPGGVAFHCVTGRDRTGQVAMLLLALLGVGAAEIADDYERSAERLAPRFASRGEADPANELREFLAARGTSARELIAATLARLDLEARLLGAGLSGEDLTRIRARVLGV